MEKSVHMYAINTAHSISITFIKGSTFKDVRRMSSVITIILPSHNFCYEVGCRINISCNFSMEVGVGGSREQNGSNKNDLKKLFHISQKVHEKWEGPNQDCWGNYPIIYHCQK
jgi:hypothetical protein